MSSSSSSSPLRLGEVALCALFCVFAMIAGALVAVVLLVATSPLVAIFPTASGAKEIVLALALLWGVVTGCVVAVLTIGPWLRLRASTQIDYLDEAEAVPLELVGLKLPSR